MQNNAFHSRCHPKRPATKLTWHPHVCWGEHSKPAELRLSSIHTHCHTDKRASACAYKHTTHMCRARAHTRTKNTRTQTKTRARAPTHTWGHTNACKHTHTDTRACTHTHTYTHACTFRVREALCPTSPRNPKQVLRSQRSCARTPGT